MKDCYGNFLTEICKKNGGHHNCSHYDKNDGDCFYETSIKGPCICEYKGYCHILRQKLQCIFRKEDSSYKKEDCPFYVMFIEES